MSTLETGPVLIQDTPSALHDLADEVSFYRDFHSEPLEYQKNFLDSLITIRDSKGGNFVPYTKEFLLNMEDMAHSCEILIAMNMRDSILHESKNDPSWIIAPYSEEQLRNLDPIYAAKVLMALNERNEQLKNNGTGDASMADIVKLFGMFPKDAARSLRTAGREVK